MIEGSILVADYQALRGGALRDYQMPGLRPVMIDVCEEVVSDPAAAGELASRYEQHDGWSRRESWVERTPAVPPADSGPPLDGEWVLSATASVRLIYDGRDWRFLTIAVGAKEGTPALEEVVTLIGAGNRPALRYAVYWAAPPHDPSRIRRLCSRFLGFDRTKG